VGFANGALSAIRPMTVRWVDRDLHAPSLLLGFKELLRDGPIMNDLHRHTPLLQSVEPRGLLINAIAFCREHASHELEGRVNHSNFDAFGRLIARWDPRLWGDNVPANLTTIYSLSGQALLIDSVDAGWRLSLPGEGGQIVDAWDGRGTIKQVEYDELLRPTAVFEDGEQVEWLIYGGADLTEFNQVGQLIQHDDLAGTRLDNRFALTGEVIEQTQEFADDLDTTRWRFNALGEALEQTDALGNIQRFAHTVAGQLKDTYVQLKNRPEQQLVGDIRYDAQGRVESETAGNGVISTVFYRPEDGRLRELKATRNNGELLQQLIYDYDPVGNVIRIEDRAQLTRHFANQRIEPVSTYQYDTLYQLIEATGREAVNQGPELANYTQTYRYDAGGNMQRLTHVGAQNHSQTFATSRTSNRTLLVVNDHVPDEEEIASAFDANGNLLELQAGQALTWDRRNQLQQVRPVIRESGIDDSERYIYNAAGQRTRKIKTTQAMAVTHRAEVRYLPGLEIRNDTATGEVLHVMTAQAGGSNVRVLHWQSSPPGGIGNDQVRYSLNDHLGSSLLELDNDAQIISQEGYYPFGGTSWWAARNAVEASYKTVRYSGKERDATGLYYYGLRYYAPWLQRWINPDPDPAGAVDGLNRYCMVRNSPIRYNDNKGSNSEDPQAGSTNITLARNEQSLRGELLSLSRRLQLRLAPLQDLLTSRWRVPSYKKYVVLDYPDFAIKQFELHNPSASKDLIVHGHGRLRSPVHKIYNAPVKLNFYAPANTQLSVYGRDLYRFQTRKITAPAAEVVLLGEESRDYEVSHSPAFEDRGATFLHHSQLLNRKPRIRSSRDVNTENFHDVLIVKPGKSIALSKILTQLPSYGQVHGFFCRTRGASGPSHDPFAR
jgi:insecticidal toxin complex protein TccC